MTERYGWDTTPTPDLGIDPTKASAKMQTLANFVQGKVWGKDVASAYKQGLLQSGIESRAALDKAITTDGRYNSLYARQATSDANSTEAKTKANQALDRSANTSAQLNTLVLNGDSSVEAAQARVDTKAYAHPTLKARLDTEHQEVTAQLDQKVTKGNVSVSDINKNLGKLDQTYMSDELLQQIAGKTEINATVAPKSITTNKLASKSVTPSTTNFFVNSSNLVNHLTIINDKSINNSTGELIDNTSNSVSDFIEIKPNTTYTSYRSLRKGFYDINKNFISTDTVDGTWISPSNAYFVRIVSHTGYYGVTTQLNLGDSLLPFELFYEYIPFNVLGDVEITNGDVKDGAIEPEKTSYFKYSSNLFNKRNVLMDNVISIGGQISPNTQYCVSDFTLIKPDTQYSCLGTLRLTFYDENKEYVYDNTLDTYNEAKSFTTRSNVKYVRMSVYKIRLDVAQMNIGSSLLPYEIGGSFVKGGHIPPKSIGYDELKNITLTDDKTGEKIKIDYTDGKITKTGGDFYMLDTDLPPVFNTNMSVTDITTEVNNFKSADIYGLYDALMASYPKYITKTLIANEDSPDSLPVYRYDFKPVRPDTDVETKQIKIILASGAHPEKAGVWYVYHLFKNICENWEQDETLEILRFNIHFIVVPVTAPWSYDNGSRVNYNGVDLARNFPAGWQQGEAGNTWGGTEPLTEPEAIALHEILVNNLDALAAIDCHNFFTSPYNFLWGACANIFSRHVMRSHIQQMDRKWKKEHAFMNQDEDVFIGNVRQYAPGGSLGYQANEYGIRGALTYETGVMLLQDSPDSYTDNVMTMGYEAFTNFISTLIKELLKRQ